MPKRATALAVAVVLLDVPQAAAFLNTSERHVKNLVYNRRIPYVKVGKYLRFKQSDLAAFVEASTVPADAS